MELSQLRMFKQVADTGSIAKASERLHCVPSNITTRIKHLEEELGEALFLRRGRGLTISPAGEGFLVYANKILALCDEAKRSIRADAEPNGKLRLASIESSATSRLPNLLSDYHKAYPAVDIEFATDTWASMEAKVAKHELDGAIIAVKSVHPELNCEAIFQEELVLITSSGANDIRSPDQLVGQHIYMWPEGCPYRRVLAEWLSNHKVSAHITSIASYGTILGCVSAGAGVSLVPKGLYEHFKTMGGIKGFMFDELKPMQNYFISSKNIGHHRARDVFVELLRSSA